MLLPLKLSFSAALGLFASMTRVTLSSSLEEHGVAGSDAAIIFSQRFCMMRAASICLLLVPMSSMAQQAVDRGLLPQTVCGPVGIKTQMLDPSSDGLRLAHQRVEVTLANRNSLPIVAEELTLHFSGETATSGAPFGWRSKDSVGAKQEVVFVELTTVSNPVSYLELNSVSYSDGSSWQPSGGEGCRIVPEPLKK